MDPDPIKIQLFLKNRVEKIIKIIDVRQSYVKKCMPRIEYDCRIRMDPDPISRTDYS